MQKYSGEVAQKYKQTQAKKSLLIPALDRLLPLAQGNSRLLDVGCGDAFLCPITTAKHYQYFGLDISADMLDRAKKEHPEGTYALGSSLQMHEVYKEKFDVIVISMLFLIFNKHEDIEQTLREAKKLLQPNGIILVGNPHPGFDSYMRKSLFNQEDVTTDFKGYFASGTQYFVNKKLNGSTLNFENYHWPLSVYIDAIHKSGLHLQHMDECASSSTTPLLLNDEYHFRRDQYPTYLALVLTHA